MENSRNGKKAKKPSSLEEWLEAFGHFKNEDEASKYYLTLLDFPDWRPQAVAYLLDGLDYGRGNLLPGNCGPAIRPQVYCRTTMVELLLAYLADQSHLLDGVEIEPPHWTEDCAKETELFPRLLRSLRLLRVGYPLNAEYKHRICAFLEHCVRYEGTDKERGFARIRNEFRDELYKALAEYELFEFIPNSALIQHAFTGNRSRKEPKTWGEWLSGLLSASSNQGYIAYLGTALDYYTWRPQAVLFLLDIVDYEEDRQGWKQCNIPAPLKKNERYEMLLAASCKLRAADLIIFDYIKGDPREDRAPWVEDCEKEPGLFPRLLRSLYLHCPDEYMRDQTRFPRSVVKKFLRNCVEVSGHDEYHKFADMRTKHLPVLYKALAEYEMAHLIVSRDEASLQALEQIVFGPRDTSDVRLIYDCEPPKDMHEALLCSYRVRRSCADRLYLLRGISKAKQIQVALKKRDENRKVRQERISRIIAKQQQEASEREVQSAAAVPGHLKI
ncbi:MAG: hypothetical protein WCW31_00540 [Patescibacteria group bacterium]|jgi:hypothetical protein